MLKKIRFPRNFKPGKTSPLPIREGRPNQGAANTKQAQTIEGRQSSELLAGLTKLISSKKMSIIT